MDVDDDHEVGEETVAEQEERVEEKVDASWVPRMHVRKPRTSSMKTVKTSSVSFMQDVPMETSTPLASRHLPWHHHRYYHRRGSARGTKRTMRYREGYAGQTLVRARAIPLHMQNDVAFEETMHPEEVVFEGIALWRTRLIRLRGIHTPLTLSKLDHSIVRNGSRWQKYVVRLTASGRLTLYCGEGKKERVVFQMALHRDGTMMASVISRLGWMIRLQVHPVEDVWTHQHEFLMASRIHVSTLYRHIKERTSRQARCQRISQLDDKGFVPTKVEVPEFQLQVCVMICPATTGRHLLREVMYQVSLASRGTSELEAQWEKWANEEVGVGWRRGRRIEWNWIGIASDGVIKEEDEKWGNGDKFGMVMQDVRWLEKTHTLTVQSVTHSMPKTDLNNSQKHDVEGYLLRLGRQPEKDGRRSNMRPKYYYVLRGRFLFHINIRRIAGTELETWFEQDFFSTKPVVVINRLSIENLFGAGCWVLDVSKVHCVRMNSTSEDGSDVDQRIISICLGARDDHGSHVIRLQAWSIRCAQRWYEQIRNAVSAWKQYIKSMHSTTEQTLKQGIPGPSGTSTEFVQPWMKASSILWPICANTGCVGVIRSGWIQRRHFRYGAYHFRDIFVVLTSDAMMYVYVASRKKSDRSIGTKRPRHAFIKDSPMLVPCLDYRPINLKNAFIDARPYLAPDIDLVSYATAYGRSGYISGSKTEERDRSFTIWEAIVSPNIWERLRHGGKRRAKRAMQYGHDGEMHWFRAENALDAAGWVLAMQSAMEGRQA